MIRRPTGEDGGALAAMLTQLDRETTFMMLEPGERSEDPRELAAWITAMDPGSECYLALFRGPRAFGFAHAERGRYRRTRHCAVVVIGMLADVRRAGWGRRLLAGIDAWALDVGVIRLELTVMIHNATAITLYEKCGYQFEGRRSASLVIDQEPVDELAMAKILPLRQNPTDEGGPAPGRIGEVAGCRWTGAGP